MTFFKKNIILSYFLNFWNFVLRFFVILDSTYIFLFKLLDPFKHNKKDFIRAKVIIVIIQIVAIIDLFSFFLRYLFWKFSIKHFTFSANKICSSFLLYSFLFYFKCTTERAMFGDTLWRLGWKLLHRWMASNPESLWLHVNSCFIASICSFIISGFTSYS